MRLVCVCVCVCVCVLVFVFAVPCSTYIHAVYTFGFFFITVEFLKLNRLMMPYLYCIYYTYIYLVDKDLL